MWKSRGCDTMTGTGESLLKWSSESKERAELGGPDPGWMHVAWRTMQKNK